MSLDVDAITRNFKWVLLGITVAFFAWLFLRGEWTADERKRLVVITVLFVAASVFWMAYEQAGSTLNLFAERSVDNSVFGPRVSRRLVPVAAGAVHHPLRAAVRRRSGSGWGPGTPRARPSSPSASCCSPSRFALMIGAASAAAGGARVSPMWLVLSYLLQVLGELCLSPVGLSAMSRLAPARVAGLVMGVWFLASAVGNYLAGIGGERLRDDAAAHPLHASSRPSRWRAALVLALMIKPIRRMLER